MAVRVNDQVTQDYFSFADRPMRIPPISTPTSAGPNESEVVNTVRTAPDTRPIPIPSMILNDRGALRLGLVFIFFVNVPSTAPPKTGCNGHSCQHNQKQKEKFHLHVPVIFLVIFIYLIPCLVCISVYLLEIEEKLDLRGLLDVE